MKNLIMTMISLLCISITTIANTNTATYQEDFSNFNNPERGFLLWSNSAAKVTWNCIAGEWTPCPLYNLWLKDFVPYNESYDNHSTIVRQFNLREFVNDNNVISQSFLNNMQDDFDFLRNNGLKATVIFEYRGSVDLAADYNVGEYALQNNHPDVQTVLNQIDQLAPVLQANSDVIYSMRAGFIGPFGEWFGSEYEQDFGKIDNCKPNLGFYDYQVDNRRAIVDKLLAVLPKNRKIELRNLQEKVLMYGHDIQNDRIQLSEAHDGSVKSRLGSHADGSGGSWIGQCNTANAPGYLDFDNCTPCYDFNIPLSYNQLFLYDECNYGTFCAETSTQEFYEYMDYYCNETTYTPSYAEFYICDKPQFYRCSYVIPDFEEHHMTTLRATDAVLYDAPESWQNGGCLDEIKRRLGYRFVMTNASVSNQVKPGGSIDLTVNLNNVGFSAPVNPRNVQLVFRHNGNGTTYKVNLCNQDPRFWFPNQITTISETVGIPNNMPNGTYSLLLNLNDPEPSLYNDARYSMRIANQNIWESNTGYNKLLMNVQVGTFNTASYNGNQILDNANLVGANCGFTYDDGSITGSGNAGSNGGNNNGNNNGGNNNGGNTNCPIDLTLNASNNVTSGNNGDQSVQNEIEATNTIYAGGSATYKAGNRIVFKPGFKALFGSYFHAFIAACTNPKLAKPDEDKVVKNVNDIDFGESLTIDDKLNEELQIYPNPLKDGASIYYNLKVADNITLTLFNATGKHLTTLAKNQQQSAGQHQVQLDANDLPAGLYYLQFTSANVNTTKKVMIAK